MNGETTQHQSRAKIFISYSRKDTAFADRLEAALKTRGFEPLIDRTEIYAFEEWWRRIEALIVRADTIVFVLSPDSVSSDVALREVAFAASLNKRFAPVVCRRVDDTAVPEALARLNFVFFDDVARFEESTDRLAEAVDTDIVWIRQHTEFGEAARRWVLAKAPKGLLLRSPVLEHAERWVASRPRGAPAPTDETQAFITQSRQAATRRRNILTGSLAAGLVLALGLAGMAYWQRGIALEQRNAALITQSLFLADLATQRINAYNQGAGISLALEALPDSETGITRPFVREAQVALSTAVQRLREIALFAGHGGPVTSAVFSPDGQRILTASEDGTAQIWSRDTGEVVSVLTAEKLRMKDAGFSLDGRKVVTASTDSLVRVWDTGTGQVTEVLRGHRDFVHKVAFSPDGTHVVSASQDGSVRVWDLNTGKAVTVGPVPAVLYAGFSPDGRYVVTAGWSQTAEIWEADTGKPFRAFSGHSAPVTSAELSSDGQRLLTSSWDRTALVWDVETGKVIMTLQHDDPVQRAAFSPDESQIATVSSDKTTRIWSAATGIQIEVLSGHEDLISSVAFSPDGRQIVTASADKTARVWNIENLPVVLDRHRGGLRTVSYSSDGTRIISVSNNDTAQIWDAKTRAATGVVLTDKDLTTARFSADRKRIVTASKLSAQVWDGDSRELLVTLSGHTAHVQSADFSLNGQQVLTSSMDKTARVWDINTGQTVSILNGHGGAVDSASFSPDGLRILTTARDNTARIWDTKTYTTVAVLEGHKGEVWRGRFSQSGTRVITASMDGTARLWDVATGNLLSIFEGHQQSVFDAAFSPDESRIVTASFDKTIRIWSTRTGRSIAELQGHTDSVDSVEFSPDGLHVISASRDGTARIWPVSNLREVPDNQVLLKSARIAVPRCLTLGERVKAFLENEPPSWCIRMKKWPYNSSAWADWLQYKRQGLSPPLPTAENWQSWISSTPAATKTDSGRPRMSMWPSWPS
jgi:WD40 repeat protein